APPTGAPLHGRPDFYHRIRTLARFDQGNGANLRGELSHDQVSADAYRQQTRIRRDQPDSLKIRNPRTPAARRDDRGRRHPRNGGPAMIPFVAVVTLRDHESRTFRLWVPLFLIWLL